MKVFCINDDFSDDYEDCFPSRTPQLLEIYTVLETTHCKNGCCTFYELEEMQKDFFWTAENFVPISDIDETEMERDYNKVLIEQNKSFFPGVERVKELLNQPDTLRPKYR